MMTMIFTLQPFWRMHKDQTKQLVGHHKKQRINDCYGQCHRRISFYAIQKNQQKDYQIDKILRMSNDELVEFCIHYLTINLNGKVTHFFSELYRFGLLKIIQFLPVVRRLPKYVIFLRKFQSLEVR